MTDYCDCGHKAEMLCERCKRPTCALVDTAHEAIFHNIDMGCGLSIDLKASHWNRRGVCPICLPGMASRELEEFVLPVMRIDGKTEFEKSCVAAVMMEPYKASQFPHSVLMRDRKNTLLWKTERWKGDLLPGMSTQRFAREFADAASRSARPTQAVKLSWLKSVQTYVIQTTHLEGLQADVLWVDVNGNQVFHRNFGNSKYLTPSKDAYIQIPPGAAVALGLRIPQ